MNAPAESWRKSRRLRISAVPPEIFAALKEGKGPPAGLSADEAYAYERLDFFFGKGLAYAQEMASRPQTLYGIADSPIGLAAWFCDHDWRSLELKARVFDGHVEVRKFDKRTGFGDIKVREICINK